MFGTGLELGFELGERLGLAMRSARGWQGRGEGGFPGLSEFWKPEDRTHCWGALIPFHFIMRMQFTKATRTPEVSLQKKNQKGSHQTNYFACLDRCAFHSMSVLFAQRFAYFAHCLQVPNATAKYALDLWGKNLSWWNWGKSIIFFNCSFVQGFLQVA